LKILIATMTAGGGHLAAAAALEETWRALPSRDTVKQLDLEKLYSALHRKLHSGGYARLVKSAPELWGIVFKTTDDPEVAGKLNKLQKLFPGRSRKRFVEYLEEFRPEVVLCTHYAPLEILGQLKRKANEAAHKSRSKSGKSSRVTQPWKPFVVSVVTDFEAHAMWMDAGVDLYCVAARETAARLIARGAEKDSIVATGIPVAAKFGAKVNAHAVRKAMGLRDDLPTLLVLSGGFGMGPVGNILTALDKVPREFQTVVVCGRNEELRRELAAQDRKHPTRVLGFASNMHELMTIADLILTKPGGLTSSEALALGKPLFILDPIPGQEAANSDFLLERGAAAKVNRVEDLPFRLEQLLGSTKLIEMAKAARALGRLKSAEAVCREVRKRVAKSKPAK
jgi:processive 1,2-diacylglycerol beta-glucosyltransferase